MNKLSAKNRYFQRATRENRKLALKNRKSTLENCKSTIKNHKLTMENRKPTMENYKSIIDNRKLTINKRKPTSNYKRPINTCKKAILLNTLIATLLVLIFLSGFFIHEDKIAPNFAQANLKPSLQHLFGTDWLGRDIFLRTMKGLNTSITIGLTAASMSAILAFILGAASALGSKTVLALVNWLINLVMGIPHMIFLILISFACGRGMKGIMLGIILTHWTSLARVIQAEILQIRSLHYVKVAKKLGRSQFWILKKHFWPQLVPQFIVGLILTFPHAIIHEASISFLGYGLSPEQASIGIILSESMRYLSSGMWWLIVYPGLTLVCIVLLFDKLGGNFKYE